MIPAEAIAENLENVRRRIAAAALRAGRTPDSVTLVAVTKTVDVGEVRALWELGVRDFAESRVQELQRKQAALWDVPVRWHMIGHLQRNKAAKVVRGVELIHSLDNVRLAMELENIAAKQGGPVLRALFEVNVSGEATKGGFRPEEVFDALRQLAGCPHLRVEGLMTMAPYADDPQAARPFFAALRRLRDAVPADLPPNVALRRLSMGMSNDFEVAIEEGADLVRVGTALFVRR